MVNPNRRPDAPDLLGGDPAAAPEPGETGRPGGTGRDRGAGDGPGGCAVAAPPFLLLVLLALTASAGPEEDRERILPDAAAAVRFTQLTVNPMRLLPGVTVVGSPGTAVE